MSQTPQGWYADPQDNRRLRWWDGGSWTEHTMDHPGQQAPAQPAGGQQAASHQPGGGEQAGGQQPGGGQQAGGQQPWGQQQPAQQGWAGQPGGGQQAGGQQPPAQQPGNPGQGNGPGSQAAYAQAQADAQGWARSGGQQQYAGDRPAYLQDQPNRGKWEQRAHNYNEGIAQGFGDQNFGGHMQGQAGATTAGSDRSILTERTLIVSQKRKIIEMTNEYFVYGSDGATLGAVVEVGQSGMRKALRLMTNYDQYLTHRLEVRDNQGQPLLRLTRPAKLVKSSVIVENTQGQEVGRLVQRNVFGKIRFGLEVNGQEIGSLNAENWRAWNFALLDAQGTEVARVTKTWEGLLTTMFTTADNYAVQIHFDLPDPLRSLCVAAALTIDTALKQDDR